MKTKKKSIDVYNQNLFISYDRNLKPKSKQIDVDNVVLTILTVPVITVLYERMDDKGVGEKGVEYRKRTSR